MAELPDLTVFAQILNHRFAGKTLKLVEVTLSKKLNVPVTELKTALEGKKLNQVLRDGKTLQLHFSGGAVLGLHLMLRGELVLVAEGKPAPKFQIISLNFTGAQGFAVIDFLKQATPTLQPAKAKAPDALEMDYSYFKELLTKKKTKIKTLLMDQQALRGIGNSYADEILWAARISPLSIANKITDQGVKKLFNSIGSVLQDAIDAIGKENGNELTGELRDFMQIHGAGIVKSPTGATVRSVKIGGRMSYFTNEQKLFN